MPSMDEFMKKLKDPFNLLAIASLTLGVISLYKKGPMETILTLLLVLALLSLGLSGAYRLMKWRKAQSSIQFYPNWDEAPKKYKFDETLKHIGEKQYRLEIAARTCFRLLCGDEKEYETNHHEFITQKKNIQNQIQKSINNGGSIYLILQNPALMVPYWSKRDNLTLQKHLNESIDSFKEISDRLTEDQKKKFRLFFANEVIENSMTRLVHNDKIIRFILDISIKFKSNSNVSKPFVVFESGKYDFSDYKEEFDYLLKHSTSKEEYEKKLSDGLLKIESLKNEYGYFSKLRRDRSEKLISLASHHFLIDNKSSIGRNFPPVCVQLLVTNECTTHCKMCDHYKIKNDKGKLGTNDIKSIIDSIKFLGTKSIVISGGEPLSREDIFQILTYSTERKIIDRLNPNLKTEHPGLKVGLLTNGIKKGGSPLTETDCEIIKETCSWVQLSIDSFVDENYEKIRGKRYLGVAIESLKKLSNVGYKNLEVCYTIQKDNFQELLNFHDCINRIPSSIEIRFKFAHGPSKKQEFLCSSAELRQLVQSAPFREKRFNFNYLISMINSNYFDYDGLSNGMPLRNKMIEYKSLKYKCHALRLTCKIDHNGDVYPCCFLFDDNNSESNFRRDYFIGSLRTPSGNIMPPENDGSGNKLSELWFKSDKLEMLRSRLLPVDDEACTYCTRHFYQNEYMNRATEIFTELSDCGVAENIAQKTNFESIGNFWV